MKKNVIILGSTGSIGINTLEVVSNNLDKFNIFALAANSSIENLSIQCQKFNPAYVHVNKEEDAKKLSLILNNFRVKSKILFGREALNDLVSTSEVDTVVCAISGSAMALENNTDKIYGFQFHPESFLTENGNLLIKKILSA